MILLTSTSCAPCKVIKDFITENDIEYMIRVVDISSEEGLKLVQDNAVRSVPALITTSLLLGEQPILKTLKDIIKED